MVIVIVMFLTQVTNIAMKFYKVTNFVANTDNLLSSVRNAPSLTTFRSELKTVLVWSLFDND